MHRLLNLPLVYTIEGIPPRKKNPIVCRVVSFMPVQVPVFEEGEAPLVLEVEVNGKQYRFYEINDQVAIVSEGSDQFLLNSDAFSRSSWATVSPADRLMTPFWHYDLSSESIPFDETIYEDDIENSVRTISFSTKEKQVAHFLENTLSKFAVINDRLHVLNRDPRWRVRKLQFPQGKGEVALDLSFHRGGDIAGVHFRFDRLDQAIEYARKRFGDITVQDVHFRDLGLREWKADEQREMNNLLTSDLRTAWYGENFAIYNMPPGFFNAFCHLRDGLQGDGMETVGDAETLLSYAEGTRLEDRFKSILEPYIFYQRSLRGEEYSDPDLANLKL